MSVAEIPTLLFRVHLTPKFTYRADASRSSQSSYGCVSSYNVKYRLCEASKQCTVTLNTSSFVDNAITRILFTFVGTSKESFPIGEWYSGLNPARYELPVELVYAPFAHPVPLFHISISSEYCWSNEIAVPGK